MSPLPLSPSIEILLALLAGAALSAAGFGWRRERRERQRLSRLLELLPWARVDGSGQVTEVGGGVDACVAEEAAHALAAPDSERAELPWRWSSLGEEGGVLLPACPQALAEMVRRLHHCERVLEDRTAWSRAFQSVSGELAACASIDELMTLAVRVPTRGLGLSTAWLTLPDDGGAHQVARAMTRDGTSPSAPCACALRGGHTGRPELIVPDLVRVPCETRPTCTNTCATFPIEGLEDVSATLIVHHTGDTDELRDAYPLLEAYCRLLGEVWQRTLTMDSLRRAQRDAEAANRAKSAFLANMSHEIRTPLNAILGYSQLLVREEGVSRSPHLDGIIVAGEHLHALISDLLEMSKIDAGRIELAPNAFSIIRTLDGLQRMFRPRVEGKGLLWEMEVEGTLPDYVEADEAKLRQILINLVGNAIKFTDEGHIRLKVRYDAPTAALRVDVDDTGIGIPREDQGAVFGEFQQGSRRHRGGTGLGLAISQRYARMMGGDVQLVVSSPLGSQFRVDVRAPEASAPAHPPPEALDPPAEERKLQPEEPAESDIPEAARAALEGAVQAADLDQMYALLDALQATHPRSAQALRDHVDNFEYLALQALLTSPNARGAP
ncbi:MAG: hypothetical protein JXX28_07995 [Deltaproteobacteria bacterium]|nr:hypothetical protein [Deltaproteobacteria bacterium]